MNKIVNIKHMNI